LGSQRLGSEVNEQTLSVNVPEKIGFVEVFSEQDLRLLLLAIELPPDGPVEQPAVVELSEGRRLEVTVGFKVPWPPVRVVYVDPTASALLEPAFQTQEALQADIRSDSRPSVGYDKDGKAQSHIKELVGRWMAGLRFWLTPRTVTVLFAIILLVVLLLVPR